jgi:hypothetical protein
LHQFWHGYIKIDVITSKKDLTSKIFIGLTPVDIAKFKKGADFLKIAISQVVESFGHLLKIIFLLKALHHL